MSELSVKIKYTKWDYCVSKPDWKSIPINVRRITHNRKIHCRMIETIARRGPCKVPSLLNNARRQGGWFTFRIPRALAITRHQQHQQHRHQNRPQRHRHGNTGTLHTGLIPCFYLCISRSCLHQIREAADFVSLNLCTGSDQQHEGQY